MISKDEVLKYVLKPSKQTSPITEAIPLILTLPTSFIFFNKSKTFSKILWWNKKRMLYAFHNPLKFIIPRKTLLPTGNNRHFSIDYIFPAHSGMNDGYSWLCIYWVTNSLHLEIMSNIDFCFCLNGEIADIQ